MKKLILFVLMLLPMVAFGQSGELTWYDEPGEIIKEKSFEVFQTLDSNAGLANAKGGGHNVYLGQLYLIITDEQCYDGKIIKVPRKKKAYIIGTYTYKTIKYGTKTVPIIKIMKRIKRKHKDRS